MATTSGSRAAWLRNCTPTPLEHGFERPHQVLRFFLDLDLGIAQHPECALPLHLIAREQQRDELAGGLLERDHPRDPGFGGRRQADEALDLVGYANECVH